MTATPTTTAQQPTEAEYEAYLAEQATEYEAVAEQHRTALEEAEAAKVFDSISAYDDDDLVSTKTWIRWHTVSDRDVANLTRELDAVEDSFRNEDVLIGYALSGDDVADRAKLDRSTAPYLRYLAARAAAVVDRIDEKYVGWVDAERLEPVRERALELMGRISGEVELVAGRCALPSLYISGADGRSALAERVRAECPDLARRFRIATQADDSDPREFVCVDDLFVMDYDRGGARYAVLASLIYELYEDTLPDCQQCECRDDPSGWSCGGCETALPLPDDAYAAAACLRCIMHPDEHVAAEQKHEAGEPPKIPWVPEEEVIVA